MKLIGLTGGIASGKSTVAALLAKSCSVPTIDVEEIVREVVQPNTQAFQEIELTFGREYIGPDGTIDRNKLSKLVANSPDDQEELDAIVRPLLATALQNKIAHYRQKVGAKYLVIESAFIVEKNMYSMMDFTIEVLTRPAVQIARLMWRYHITKNEATAKIGSQMSVRRKAEKINPAYRGRYFVIDNTQILQTKPALERVWQTITGSRPNIA